jgi:hypothetical protein
MQDKMFLNVVHRVNIDVQVVKFSDWSGIIVNKIYINIFII